mmetsp:Transcript_145378/g.464569  ORF Transcript_145378/g.464569 Transcript_145378/m.464569 type:complete len:216 (-) Transcript_145378:909-1556(-)
MVPSTPHAQCEREADSICGSLQCQVRPEVRHLLIRNNGFLHAAQHRSDRRPAWRQDDDHRNDRNATWSFIPTLESRPQVSSDEHADRIGHIARGNAHLHECHEHEQAGVGHAKAIHHIGDAHVQAKEAMEQHGKVQHWPRQATSICRHHGGYRTPLPISRRNSSIPAEHLPTNRQAHSHDHAPDEGSHQLSGAIDHGAVFDLIGTIDQLTSREID